MPALTFDNLGEAADLERGLWPAGARLGRHPSVTRVLPRLLDELDGLGLRATFCVEAINTGLYPNALREIAARGHEVALHGWRHERWDRLPPEREARLLERGRDALSALGLGVRGFRPPGGALTDASPALLADAGFAWCSPAGARPERLGSLTSVPFAWPCVDATYRLPAFADRRRAYTGRTEPFAPAEAAAALLAALAKALDAGDPGTVVLHPFLMQGTGAFAAARSVLRELAGLGGGFGPIGG